MSEQNVALHRRVYEAFNAADVDALIALCDASIEVRSAFAAVGGGVYHGRDGVRQWHHDLSETFGGSFRIEPETFFDLGEQTLAFVVLRGQGQHSGVEVAMPGFGVAKWRRGLCVSHKGYAHKQDALTELGVSEDALEPIAP